MGKSPVMAKRGRNGGDGAVCGEFGLQLGYPQLPTWAQHPLDSRQLLKLCKMKVQQLLAAGTPKNRDQARGCRVEALGALSSQNPRGRASRVYQHSTGINPTAKSSQRRKHQECLSLSAPSIFGSDSLTAGINGCARTCTIPSPGPWRSQALRAHWGLPGL